MKDKLVVISGYFNPLHMGHIEYIHRAGKIGDRLVVIVNNDIQRELKNSSKFQDEKERMIIMRNIKKVDDVVLSIDKDKSVSETLKSIHNKFSNHYDIFFVNGGDQTNENIPEALVCEKLGIVMLDGCGEKIQSSSWLINKK